MPNPAPSQRFTLMVKEGRGLMTSRNEQTLADYVDSFSELYNITIRDGGFRVRPSDNNAAITGSPVWATHVYNAIDTATPGTNPYGCILYASGGTTSFTGTATLRRVDQYGDNIVTVNSVNFTFTNPFDVSFLNVKNRCFVAADTPATSVVPTVITQFPTSTSYAWGIAAPTNEMTYDAYTNVTNADTKVKFHAADANVAAATTPVVTSTAGDFTTGGAWDGKAIYIDNAPVPYVISTVTLATSLTMTTNYALTTGIANKDWRVHYGELSWTDVPPSYAYAYYNPTTGHISNIGPVMRVSELNISSVRVKISNIQTTNDPNYTKIVLFRTELNGGGTLLPLKLTSTIFAGAASVDANGFIDNVGVGTVAYLDFQPDTKLGVILGRIPAPTENNKPPPSDIKLMEYWDSRIWVIRRSEPSRVYFSASVSEVPLGVPEESFPVSNYRDVPNSDGSFSTIKVVGNSLLLGADNYMYTVLGSGESTSYILSRISSRGAGVGKDGIAEFPGDTVEESASAIYCSRDNRLWRHMPGGAITDIGWPIQDKLDLIDNTLARPVVVRVAQIGKNWYVACGIRSGTTRYDWYFMDLEGKMWNDWGWAGSGVGWGALWHGVIYRLTGDLPNGIPLTYMATTGANISVIFNNLGLPETVNPAGAAMSSHWLDFGDRTAKKSLEEVILHVNDSTYSFSTQVGFDNGSLNALTLMPVTSSPRYTGGTNVLRYVWQGNPVQFHSTKVRVVIPATSTAKVNKVEIVYKLNSTGQVDG